MKRIFILADAGSEHTEKWVLGLAEKGLKIGLFSMAAPAYNWYEKNPTIQFFSEGIIKKEKKNSFSKLSYFKLIPKIKRAIAVFQPDIVHAHYATSYGILARLSGFSPYFISAWGTDVMKFPAKNFINKHILKKNLEKAALVLATSHTIKEYIHKVTNVDVKIIPFGVDLKQFKPAPKLNLFEPDALVIAAIKVLDTIYCIDILIEAFTILVKINPTKKLRLLIVGEGPQKAKLNQLCIDNAIQDKVIFTGRVYFNDVANYFNTADIFVNISEYESFGVSVIEASACEKPVIVTNVGGLCEVVEEGITGFRISVRNVDETVAAIEKLILYPDVRKKLGMEGRKKVMRQFDWESNLNEMVEVYNQY